MTGDFHLIKPQEKNEWAAHILNFIFPGVGLIYWRRGTMGLAWLGLSLGMSIGMICFWMLVPFLPQLLAALLILYWLWVEWLLIESIRGQKSTQTLWSRGGTGLPPFFGLAFLCLALFTLVFYIAMTRVYSFVHVRDMSMYPQLLKGDVLLVDRRVYEGRSFLPGEVIAYDSRETGVTISRVITSPKYAKRVEVLGAQVNLDDEKLYLMPIDIELKYLEKEENQPFLYQQFYLEYAPVSIEGPSNDRTWIVSEPIDPSKGKLSLNGHLGKNTLLVLPDVRISPMNDVSHHGEIIDRSRIIGRPVMVVSSSYPHPKSDSRRGIVIR